VHIAGQPDQHFILNALRVIKCIDDEASEEVQYWTEEDGLPEKVGEYASVFGMRIDTTKVGSAQMFRTWGWEVALIVSEDIKEAFERAGITGAKFKEVTGPGSVTANDSHPETKHDELLKQLDAARDGAYRSLGQLDEAAIVPIVPGGPSWPGQRQAWRVIHRRTLGPVHRP
jgi:hypothetical protein